MEGARHSHDRSQKRQVRGNVGAGASYYKNLTGDIPIVFQSAETTKDGEPKAEVQAADTTHGQRLVVTYEQVDAAAISGAVKYVDVDGNIIETEIRGKPRRRQRGCLQEIFLQDDYR